MDQPLDVWDLGGVLVDVDFGRFSARVLDLAPDADRARLAQVPGLPIKGALDRGHAPPEEFARQVARAVGAEIGVPAFLDCWADIFTVRPEAERWLAATAHSHEQWLLSDTDPIHIARVDRDWPRMATFTRRLLSFEAGRIKVDPGAFEPLVEQVEAGRAVRFFDDRQDNVDAARAVGVPAFRFTDWAAWEVEHA